MRSSICPERAIVLVLRVRACGRINDCFHKEFIGPYGISWSPNGLHGVSLGRLTQYRMMWPLLQLGPVALGLTWVPTLWLKRLPSGPATPEPQGRGGWLILQ